jgi:hypothetical protein
MGFEAVGVASSWEDDGAFVLLKNNELSCSVGFSV